MQCRGDQEHARDEHAFWHRVKSSSRPAALAEVQTKKKSNGNQLVGRSREMLCQGGRARSFISDVAQYVRNLKEQSPVAASAYLTAP